MTRRVDLRERADLHTPSGRLVRVTPRGLIESAGLRIELASWSWGWTWRVRSDDPAIHGAAGAAGTECKAIAALARTLESAGWEVTR